LIGQRREERIIFPQIRTERSHIRYELSGITAVQVTNCRRQHHNITGRKSAFENQLPHWQAKERS
jgi:hypothetical protein